MRYFITLFILLIVAVMAVLGFRGSDFKKPPLEIFPDMDRQPRLKPQAEFSFWEDERADRPVVPGTVARGDEWTEELVFSAEYTYDRLHNPSFYTGKTASGEFLPLVPLEVNQELMELGEEKYNIYCVLCHGEAGNGKGVASSYGIAGNLNYHQDPIRNQPDGEIYNTIVNGKGLMGAYADKLNERERWAVVAYVRALQLSQNASIDDVPASHKNKLLSK